MIHKYSNETMYLIITIFTISANLLLGFISYRNNPKSHTHRLLAITTLILALWSMANYFSLTVIDSLEVLFWMRMVMFFTSFLTPVLFLFLKIFPRAKSDIRIEVWVITLGVSLVLALLSLTSLIVTNVYWDNGLYPEFGPGMFIWGLSSISFLILGFRSIIDKYKNSTGITRLQVKYLALGVFLTFSLQFFTNYFFIFLFNFASFITLGPLLSLILIGFVSYSIAWHRLLDIRQFISRLLAYTFLFLILGFFAVVVVTTFGWLVSGQGIDRNYFLLVSSLSFLAVLIFQPLRIFMEHLTDRYLFNKDFDNDAFLHNLSQVLASTLNLSSLTRKSLELMCHQMKISRADLILMTKDGFSVIGTPEEAKYLPTKEEISLLEGENRLLVFEEMEEGKTKDLFRRLNLSVCLHLNTKDQLVGFLLLGEKLSGDIYFYKDLLTLEILGPELAVAIKNALSYEEIQNFNITLKEEVRIATSELRQANIKLQELDKLKDEFVSVASHELRTPMTAIKGYLWLELNENKQMAGKTKERLDRAYKSTERLIDLVNDMLNVSRIEGGRIELIPECFDLVELGHEVREEIRIKADEKKITIEVPHEGEQLVFADKNRIHQVLINLIGNSVKFTPEGGKITISYNQNGEMVETAIKDNGIGIKKEDLGKLFAKFGRLDNSLSGVSQTPGTGLGLFICKKIIELSKGTISVQSKVGKGSTFTFSLPKAK